MYCLSGPIYIPVYYLGSFIFLFGGGAPETEHPRTVKTTTTTNEDDDDDDVGYTRYGAVFC